MVSCLMGDSTALASAIVRCCPKENHARLGYDPKYNRFRLIPADSQNNIYLNGETVDLPTPIHAFDIIEFGSTKLIFVPLCGDRFSWDMAAPDRNPL